MNDRELLELAALAAGLPECGWMGPAFMYVKDDTFTDWNPLEDDGDAFRLAVKLSDKIGGLVVNFADEEDMRAVARSYYLPIRTVATEGDSATMARRAIVEAAAEYQLLEESDG